MKTYSSAIFFIFLLLCLTCCRKQTETDWQLQDGYVSTEASAIKIAEVVWIDIYGEEILDNKPFKAQLVNNSVWVIEGTFKRKGLGGVPYIEIQKKDGKIIKVSHGK